VNVEGARCVQVSFFSSSQIEQYPPLAVERLPNWNWQLQNMYVKMETSGTLIPGTTRTVSTLATESTPNNTNVANHRQPIANDNDENADREMDEAEDIVEA